MPVLDVGTVIAHVFLFVSLYFEIFLLVTFLERREGISVEDREPTRYGTVTIVVPSFNEEKTVAATVGSILSLNYPRDKLSVFIIDDGSTDNTWENIQIFRSHPQVSLFRKENGGKYTALNFALGKINSEFVGCLDADSFVDKEALRRIIRRFEDKPELMAVTPAIRVHGNDNVIRKIQKAEYSLSVFIRKVFAFLDSIYITPGPFSIFRKSVFDTIGAYRHAHNTEDLEIAFRMQQHHYKIDNAHDAYVYTITPKTIRALFRQRLRWIQGFLQNSIDYRFLFFKRGYGNLSMFILPTAMLSIFSALYFTGYIISNAVEIVIGRVAKISAIGFTVSLPSFDWFFVKTESIFILSFMLLCLTTILIVIGRYITERRVGITRDILYFIFLYSFIAPLWLGKAVYNSAFSRRATWR